MINSPQRICEIDMIRDAHEHRCMCLFVFQRNTFIYIYANNILLFCLFHLYWCGGFLCSLQRLHLNPNRRHQRQQDSSRHTLTAFDLCFQFSTVFRVIYNAQTPPDIIIHTPAHSQLNMQICKHRRTDVA